MTCGENSYIKAEQPNADKFAKMSVWDIFQPMVSNASSDYKLEVAFE